MDITTQYMGLTLRSPLVASASPLSQQLDNIRRMEDAGAAAVVLYSLFEEQLRMEELEHHHYQQYGAESFAEALTYFPEPDDYKAGPDEYLEHIRSAKEAVDMPIIASLNGDSPGGWTEFAKKIEEAGADALELNIYAIPTDFNRSGSDVEQDTINIVSSVTDTIDIPVAVKLSPYYSNMANMAKRLDEAGASGLVLFNRFYQPDIDLETLEVRPNVLLSTPQALRLPLRWIAIMYGNIQASIAATSGIHNAEDVIKVSMAGASVAMMASALLRHGINYLRTVEADLIEWLVAYECESLQQIQGSLSQKHSTNPTAFERAQYIRSISSLPPELS